MEACSEPTQDTYAVALKQEQHIYEDCLAVHNLPEIFHYWSNRHLRPRLLPYGLQSSNAVFTKHIQERCRNSQTPQKRFVSLGAGNCELEIEIALHLRTQGMSAFSIECLDLNAAMLERGRARASIAGVANQLRFVQGDLNAWSPTNEYDAAVVNHTLHHVVNLEHLFDQVKRSLRPDGLFVVSDMIGRNGHQRWPEALQIVREFWRTLPPSYRFNSRFGYYDELYEDWDCSVEGFEGVRAQDILPLLLDRFHFQLFIPFGNVIDPFIDRTFGQNFNVGRQWDRDFIDRVHHRDEEEIACGRIKPTHMLAVLGKDPKVSPLYPPNLSPPSCVRPPAASDADPVSRGGEVCYLQSWPQSAERELQIACQRLGDAGRQIRARTIWALDLNKRLIERTAWAVELDKQLEERTGWAFGLEKQLEERTAWALRLDKELEANAAYIVQLQSELQTETSRAARLEQELHRYIHNPIRFLVRLAAGVRNRVRRVLFGRGRA